MRDYAKTGGKEGRPGYRTPASFIARKTAQLWRSITRKGKGLRKGEKPWPLKQKEPIAGDK